MLDREPESDAAVAALQRLPDRAALLRTLVNSAEALARPGAVVPIGLHMAVATNAIALDATPAQRDAMLARIAAAWRAYGESEPHWSVLTDPAYLAESLDLDDFYASGAAPVGLLCAALARNGIDPAALGRVLDFAAVWGRFSLALSDHFAELERRGYSPAPSSKRTRGSHGGNRALSRVVPQR